MNANEGFLIEIHEAQGELVSAQLSWRGPG